MATRHDGLTIHDNGSHIRNRVHDDHRINCANQHEAQREQPERSAFLHDLPTNGNRDLGVSLYNLFLALALDCFNFVLGKLSAIRLQAFIGRMRTEENHGDGK